MKLGIFSHIVSRNFCAQGSLSPSDLLVTWEKVKMLCISRVYILKSGPTVTWKRPLKCHRYTRL